MSQPGSGYEASRDKFQRRKGGGDGDANDDDEDDGKHSRDT